MRREVIPGLDRPLTVSEISEHFGPVFRKQCEDVKDFLLKGGKLDGWREYEVLKEREKKGGEND